MTEDARLRQLEVQVATLKSDFGGHVVLCNGRWNVIWKLAGALSVIVSAVVSVAISLARS